MKNDFTIRDGVAVVELTQGRSMLVAEAALSLIAPRRWRAQRNRRTWYAVTNVRLPDGRKGRLYAHRLLCQLDFGDPREGDHIDGDGLNNLPSNLRVTDSIWNNYNRRKPRWHDGRAPTSRYPGVYWDKDKTKWRTRIKLAGRTIYLGLYTDESSAAEAYRRAKAVRDAGGTREEVRTAGRDPRSCAAATRPRSSSSWPWSSRRRP
jgi:hypothetical protein